MPAGITAFGIPTSPESAKEKDARLFKTWKTSTGFAKSKALEELLDELRGPIFTAVNAYLGAPLPRKTLELEAQRFALEGLNAYNPTLADSLSSYIITFVKQKLYRYVSTYQNVARIPEYQVRKIAPLREATADLTQKLGREPTTVELADHLGVPLTKVTQLRRIMRKDLLEEGPGMENVIAFEHDPAYEKAMLAYYAFSDIEKTVFDHSLGAHGQVQLSTNDLAAKLKLSAARVSQLKKQIAEKIKPYLGNI